MYGDISGAFRVVCHFARTGVRALFQYIHHPLVQPSKPRRRNGRLDGAARELMAELQQSTL